MDAPKSQQPTTSSPSIFRDWRVLALLLAALLAGLFVYWPATGVNRAFYDDLDYVTLDPRLDHLELYFPNHWGEAPPPLEKPGQPPLFIPGYDKPIYAERFLWHLSFAIERQLFGVNFPASHGINIAIHLGAVAMLFFALARLVRLYFERFGIAESSQRVWRLLPGVAALFFAVHPWASEPVCYVSARNGSMGAFFALAGLWCWTWIFGNRHILLKALAVGGALLCAVAAYACKENFVAAPAGFVLATWPLVWSRLGTRAKIVTVGAAALALLLVASVGIHYSDRANFLFAQSGGGQGWTYFFEIQSPILLMTFLDEFFCRRIGLEANYPGWPAWASWLSILVNCALIAWALWRGRKQPAWLALVWFYLMLLPSNSFLPRPDFLAGRNVYLPTAGAATLIAAALLALIQLALSRQSAPAPAPVELNKRGGIATSSSPPGVGRHKNARVIAVACLGAALWVYFAVWSYQWANAFVSPLEVWKQCMRVAPDHAVVLLNYCIELEPQIHDFNRSEEARDLEAIAHRAIESEGDGTPEHPGSPTMRYHTERPRRMARANAYLLLADLKNHQGDFTEAERLCAQSWAQARTPDEHLLAAWAYWVDICKQHRLDAKLDAVLGEGLRAWPNGWWSRAQRGVQRYDEFGSRHSVPPQIMDDLEAAEVVPNMLTNANLARIQFEALRRYAFAINDKRKAMEVLERLKAFGDNEEAIESLRQQILQP